MKKIIPNFPETISLEPSLTVAIRQSHRASRVSVRIRGTKVELIIPVRADYQKAIEFLKSKHHWIKAKLAVKTVPEPHVLADSATISVLGKPLRICHTGLLRGVTRMEGDMLVVSGDISHMQRRVTDYLRARLAEEIEVRAAGYAATMQRKVSRISLRDTTSRWGSCSSSGNLSFSWRLIFAPLAVLDYVVAHEVCHLREMNHSDRFWELVATLCPDYKQHRSWLKKHGASLHAIG